MIKVGDLVRVIYNQEFAMEGWYFALDSMECEVLHVPQDTGDHWHFRDIQTDVVFTQNPMSSNLNVIALMNKPEKKS